jgi:LPS-assembly protein
LYYLYVPRREQDQIPVFDTALVGFSYANMFRENRYAGQDRIGDANEVTLAVTSRLLDPASGGELLRATLGTRYYFSDQQVTLPGEPRRDERKADILAALTGLVLPKTYADIGWQYNPRDARTERATFGGRYHPAPGKIINAAYRYARDSFAQVDVSGQWPLQGGWHGVGRFNYSTKESRLIEAIAGLEYDAGCWVGRAVFQRLATIADRPTSALFFQLELNDFSRIGSNPLDLLKRNIPGYGMINQPTADPVFAEN